MSKKTELVEAILKIRKKENDIAEAKYLYTLTNQQLEKIYNSESKRTEQEVLKDFEKLGYEVFCNNDLKLRLEKNNKTITISKLTRWYSCKNYDYLGKEITVHIDMQEHKLLTDLFKIWGWL